MEKIEECFFCKKPLKESYFYPSGDFSHIDCGKCGEYRLTGKLSRKIYESGVEIPKPHRYAGAVRELNLEGKVPIIENLDDILNQVNAPRNPLEQMDRLLINMSKVIKRPEQVIPLEEINCWMGYASDLSELAYLFAKLVGLGHLDHPVSSAYRIDTGGWRRLAELSENSQMSDQAFVAMSFHEELYPIYVDGIKAALDDTGFKPFRVDQEEHNNRIDDYIIASIRKSGLLVADFTGQRPGVYFEAGFGLGLGIPVIWCCREDEREQLHFDTRQFNHILWTDAEDLRVKLRNRINATAIPGK